MLQGPQGDEGLVNVGADEPVGGRVERARGIAGAVCFTHNHDDQCERSPFAEQVLVPAMSWLRTMSMYLTALCQFAVNWRGFGD
jgi:hypothetical protein